MTRVLIIGGYGNFGGYIARALATDANISLLIGGRSQTKADAFAASLHAFNPASGCAVDIDGDIEARLREIGPDIVIHTTGPFQGQDHRVARAAIAAGAHYLDLADAREFVATIGDLDAAAKKAGVAAPARAPSPASRPRSSTGTSRISPSSPAQPTVSRQPKRPIGVWAPPRQC